MSLEKAAGSKTFLNSYDNDDSLETFNTASVRLGRQTRL